MTRVRLIALTVFGLALLPLTGGVFGSFMMVSAIPFSVVAVVGLATATRSRTVGAIALAAGLVVATIGTTFLAGGRTGEEFIFAFGPAASRLLTTTWPSPRRPELVGLISLIAAAALALAHFVGRSARRRVVALVPVLAAAVVLTVAGAKAGPHVVVWCWFLLTAIGFLVVSTRGAVLRTPDPQAVVVAALAVVVVGGVGSVLPSTGRFDPRRSNIEEIDAFVPPVEEFANLGTIDPPENLFEISGEVDDLQRFRAVVYGDYDGTRWEAGFDLEEVGTVVRAGADADHDYQVWPLDNRMRFLPFAGEPVEIDARIAVNRERDVVALLDDDVTKEPIRVRTEVGSADATPVSQEFVSTSTSGPFAAAANEIVGDETNLAAKLDLLERSMTGWDLNPPNRPSPLQSKLLADFVSQSRRGGQAQFVAAFVLMARTLGADARVVGGFVVDERVLPGGSIVVDTSNTRLWAEVRTEDGGWRSYDPVPDEFSPDDESNVSSVPSPREGSASPPDQVPPDVDDNDPETPPTDDQTAGRWPIWALGLASAAFVLVAGVMAILMFKGARRWYWMGVGDLPRRTRGAWAEATSTLIDAGLPVRDSWTDLDIVDRAASIDGVAVDDVARLARAARTVAFSPLPPPMSVDELNACRASVRSVRRGISSCRSWRGRARMRLSVRSVWPTTRTPVLKR